MSRTLRLLLLWTISWFCASTAFARITTDVVTLRHAVGQQEIVEVSQSNFDVEALQTQAGWIPEIIARADTARRIVNDRAGDALMIRIRIVLAPDSDAFYRLAGPGTENSTAVSLKNIATIVMNGDALRAHGFEPLGRILVHEMVHVYLDARCYAPVPRWMHEGLAQIISGEWTNADASAILATRMVNRLIPLSELEYGFPSEAERQQLAYRQSSSVVQFILKERFDGSLRHLIQSITGEEGRREIELYWSPVYRDALQAQWRSSLTTWTDWASLLLSSSLLWGGAAVLLVAAYWLKRRRNRPLREEWEEEEKVYASLDEAEEDEWIEPEFEDEYDEQGNWKGRRKLDL